MSHKPGGRLPLLSARPAVTLATLRGLLPISLLGEQWHDGLVQLTHTRLAGASTVATHEAQIHKLKCRHGKAPQYLVDCCTPVIDVVGRQRLRVSHTATDGGPPTSANHCWTPSICCARPHGLELLAGRPPCTAGL